MNTTEIFIPTFPDRLRDGDYIRVEPSGYAGWFQWHRGVVIAIDCCEGPCVEHGHFRRIVLKPHSRVLKRHNRPATAEEIADRQTVIEMAMSKQQY